MTDRIDRDVAAFMQFRGLAASALSDMTDVLRHTSPGPDGASFLAFSAALQVIAEGYLAQGYTAEQAEHAMHHGVAVACRQRPVPIETRWIERRETTG